MSLGSNIIKLISVAVQLDQLLAHPLEDIVKWLLTLLLLGLRCLLVDRLRTGRALGITRLAGFAWLVLADPVLETVQLEDDGSESQGIFCVLLRRDIFGQGFELVESVLDVCMEGELPTHWSTSCSSYLELVLKRLSEISSIL